jgi:hypothetical protein
MLITLYQVIVQSFFLCSDAECITIIVQTVLVVLTS